MQTINATSARKEIFHLLEEVNHSHHPIFITGKNSGVLIGEQDWRDMQETLYLLSIPGMRESIVKGLKTPLSKCSDEVKW